MCFINCAVGFEAVREDEVLCGPCAGQYPQRTGNTSPRCQAFILGLWLCLYFDGNPITFLLLVTFRNIKIP